MELTSNIWIMLCGIPTFVQGNLFYSCVVILLTTYLVGTMVASMRSYTMKQKKTTRNVNLSNTMSYSNTDMSDTNSTDMSDYSADKSDSGSGTDLSDRDSDTDLSDYILDRLFSPSKKIETPIITAQPPSQITQHMNTYDIEGPIGLERLFTVVKNQEISKSSYSNECSTATVLPGSLHDKPSHESQSTSTKGKTSFRFWRRDKWNKLKYCLKRDDPRGLMEVLAYLSPAETDYKALTARAWPSLCLTKRGYRSDYVIKMNTSHGPSRKWRAIMNESSEIRLHKDTLTVMFKQGLLHKASSYGSVGCLKSLLDHGYDPNVYSVDPRETTGTPLLTATAKGHTLAIDMLVKAGGLVNIPDTSGTTALHLACRSGDFKIIKRLLRVQELRPRILNTNGQTPLSFVLYNIIHEEQVNTFFSVLGLFQEASVNVWAGSSKGRSLLHTFILNYYEDEIIEACLPLLTDMVPDLDIRAGSDVSVRKQLYPSHTPCDRLYCGCCYDVDWDVLTKGPTALFLAAKKGDGELLVELLLQANANRDARCAVNEDKLRGDWLALEQVEKVALEHICPTFAVTLSKLQIGCHNRYQLVTPIERAMLLGRYKSASLLIKAGQHVSSLQSVDTFRPFLINQDESDDSDDDSTDDVDSDYDDNNERLLKLLGLLEAPQTLQWWCRRSIRTRLPKGHGRCREAVRSLPMPSKIQRYIMLDQ